MHGKACVCQIHRFDSGIKDITRKRGYLYKPKNESSQSKIMRTSKNYIKMSAMWEKGITIIYNSELLFLQGILMITLLKLTSQKIVVRLEKIYLPNG